MRVFTTIAIAVGGVIAAQPGAARTVDYRAENAAAQTASIAASWEQVHRDDPADSLYQLARKTLNDGNNRRAADLFKELQRRYPQSSYIADAMYFQAFALSRTGSERDLRTAVTVLKEQQERFPNASSGSDSKALLAQIQGQLAQKGDQEAARRIQELAKGAQAAARDAQYAGGRSAAGGSAGACNDDDMEMRATALQALLQMNAEDAMPILKNVLARRDECSAELRQKAVFIVAQHHSDETESILLSTARNDPDSDVRQQAVFWLSEVHTDHALAALDSILHSSPDEDVQEKAIFSIANSDMPRSIQMLETYASTASNPEELRAKAVFWIGQRAGRDPQVVTFLRSLFDKTTDSEDIQNAIIQAVSEMRGDDSNRWLMDVVTDEKQPVETRKKALFWLGQRETIDLAQLMPLYDRLKDQELREHFIFVLSQRRESAATDKLIQIAKSDPDKEMRKKAIFWLAQKNDPRAKQLLLEIINQ